MEFEFNWKKIITLSIFMTLLVLSVYLTGVYLDTYDVATSFAIGLVAATILFHPKLEKYTKLIRLDKEEYNGFLVVGFSIALIFLLFSTLVSFF